MNGSLVVLLVVLIYSGLGNAFQSRVAISAASNRLKAYRNQRSLEMGIFGRKKWSPHTAVGTQLKKKTVDPVAILSYIGATSVQFALIFGFLHILQLNVLDNIKPIYPKLPTTLPVQILDYYKRFQLKFPKIPPHFKVVIVAIFMAFMSLKSRVFSPLDNSRPSANKNDPNFNKNRLRPSWTPPPLAFPIIWTSIGVLRTVSTVLIYKTTGTLLCLPIYALMAHLSIGDTWNTINNVEKRLGTAVLGVFFVWASALAATYLYYQTLPLAGKILAPMSVWLSIAALLVYSIWRMNSFIGDRLTLLPSKEEGPPSRWKLPFTSLSK
jgi:tryptophan-rich sensory protein